MKVACLSLISVMLATQPVRAANIDGRVVQGEEGEAVVVTKIEEGTPVVEPVD